jgi:hypothetical protein
MTSDCHRWLDFLMLARSDFDVSLIHPSRINPLLLLYGKWLTGQARGSGEKSKEASIARLSC